MGLATVKTDIAGFDTLLGGGIPKGSSLLVSGPPGAGKTVLALQYTFNQARKGERVLFVSTCELLYTINKFASSMSFFDLALIRTGVNLDFYGPREEGGFVEFWDYSLGPVLEEQYAGDIFDVIQDRVSSHRIDHLVIDSVTSIDLFLGDAAERRKKLLLFMGWASRSGCTTILTAEPLDHTGAERLLVDGIVDLGRHEVPGREGLGVAIRTIEVPKLRGQEHCAGRYIYNITGDGIGIMAPGTGEPPAGEAAKTGIADLDRIIEGMAYGSVWHFGIYDAAFLVPLTDSLIKEAISSGDCLIYVAPPGYDLSLESFRKRFGHEAELKGQVFIIDLFGRKTPDKLKDLVIALDPEKYAENASAMISRLRLKGKRSRIIVHGGGLVRSMGPDEAAKAYNVLLGYARESNAVLITIGTPWHGGSLPVEQSSDGVVDIWDYGGYALLHVKKAPYARSFEPFTIRLKDGHITLMQL